MFAERIDVASLRQRLYSARSAVVQVVSAQDSSRGLRPENRAFLIAGATRV